jgi:uncharacterized protein YbbK (DUF523 family)
LAGRLTILNSIICSRCLLGVKCRYDGGHNHIPEIETLLKDYKIVDLCPEADLGMPIPREAISLVGSVENPAVTGRQTGRQWADELHSWSKMKLIELLNDSTANTKICGAIMKSRSPSCGNGDTERFPKIIEHNPVFDGFGIFIIELKKLYPKFPIINEEQFADPILRNDFFCSVNIWDNQG